MNDEFNDLKGIDALKAEETEQVNEDNGRLVFATVLILIGLALSVGNVAVLSEKRPFIQKNQRPHHPHYSPLNPRRHLPL